MMMGADPLAPAGLPAGASVEGEEQLVVDPQSLRENYGVAMYLRAFLFVLGGVVTGILGVTGYWGILAYIVLQLCASGVVFLKAGGKLKRALNLDLFGLVRLGLLDEVVPFVFFWSFAYTIVHVF